MIDLFLGFSYVGIVVLLVLTGVGLPIPEELIVVVSGIAAGRPNGLHPLGAWAACFGGAMLGDITTYAVGRHFGYTLLRDKHWFSRLLTPARERQVERMIHEHGTKVFFVARFLIGFRSPIYLTAGILRVPFRRFILVNMGCAAVIVSAFFWASYKFGEQIENTFARIRQAEIALTVIVVVALTSVALYFYMKHRRRVARLELRRRDRAERIRLIEDKPRGDKSVA